MLKKSNKELSSLNNNLKVEARESKNILAFLVKPFVFARGVQKFIWDLRLYPRYPEGLTNLFDCVSEKIGLARHFNQNTSRRTAKWGVFTPHLCKLILKKYTICPYVSQKNS